MMMSGTGGVDGMKSVLLLSTALKWSKIWARSVTLSAARGSPRFTRHVPYPLFCAIFALSKITHLRRSASLHHVVPCQRYIHGKWKDAAAMGDMGHGTSGRVPAIPFSPAQHAAANTAALERGCRGSDMGPRARARVLKLG